MNNTAKPQCPEFPYFGARYPDACCIDGYLWDLDKYEDGKLYGGGEDACPFCNTEQFIEEHEDDDWSKEELSKYVEKLKLKYNYPLTP